MDDTRTQSDPSSATLLEQEQLEHLRLQNKKLNLELLAESKRQSSYSAWMQAAPMITAMVAVAGFGWGVLQYGREQAKNRSQQQLQSDREQITAEREFMKPWLDAQRDTYQKALQAAATIANTNEPKTKKQAVADFWRLYQGEMILVETKTVSGAMVHYGKCLDNAGACGRAELNKRCRALATAMGTSMAATAKMTYKEFAANQFRYSSGM
jgi:hypothetical protein